MGTWSTPARKQPAHRHAIALMITMAMVLSFLIALPQQAALAAGAAPPMPETLALPAVPIGLSAGHTGYLPGSWQVTPSGAFAYSIPLDVPAGRAGMQPTLSLDYASGMSNGSLGVGWSVAGSSSTITRCTRSLSSDGKVAGIAFDGSDAFCWNGQKLKADGAAAGGIQHYATESDSFASITSASDRVNPGLGPYEFVVKSKDGRVLTFTQRSFIRRSSGVYGLPLTTGDVTDTIVRVLWLLSKVEDRSGNRMDYSYNETGSADLGFDVSPKQIQYTAGTGRAAQRRVEFAYENRPDASFSFVGGVKFATTQRLTTISMFAPNPATTMKVWQYNLGYSASSPSRLTSVAKCGPQSGAAGSGCLRAKLFKWDSIEHAAQPSFTGTDLAPITGFTLNDERAPYYRMIDLNGDGATDIVGNTGGTASGEKVFVRLSQRDPSTGAVSALSKHKDVSGKMAAWPSFVDLGASRPTTLNGDGTQAIIASYPAVPSNTYFDKVMKWDVANEQFYSPGTLGETRNTVLADLDGDGRMDYVTGNGSNLVVRMNPNGAFGPELKTSWVSAIPQAQGPDYFCPRPLRVTDLNGDGRAEIVGYQALPNKSCGDESILRINDVGSPVVEPAATLVNNMKYLHAPVLGEPGYSEVLGDFNGDGLEDVLLLPIKKDPYDPDCKPTPDVECDPSEPSPYAPWDRPAALLWNTGFGLAADSHVPSIAHDKFADVRTADINGDGRTDLVSFAANTSMYLSNGDGTFTATTLANDGGAADSSAGRQTAQVGDFNGDGRIDVVRTTIAGVPKLLTQNASYGHRIIKVADEGTAWDRTTVAYSSAWTDHLEKLGDYTCSYPVTCLRSGMVVARQVASLDARADSANTSPYVLHYAFEDPIADVRGSGYLGFGTMRVWDPQRPAETEYTFAHRQQFDNRFYPFVNTPSTVTVSVPIMDQPAVNRATVAGSTQANARVTRTHISNEYRKLHADPVLGWAGVYAAFPQTEYTKEWEQTVTVKWGSLAGTASQTHISGQAEPVTPPKRTDAGYDFDDFGNLTATTRATTGGASQKVETQYDLSAARVADWLIGLPTWRKLISTEPNANPSTLTRTTDFQYDAAGRLEKVWQEKANPGTSLYEATAYAYDGLGVARSVTVSANDRPDRTTHTDYTTVWFGQPDEEIYPSQVWAEHDVAGSQPSTWLATNPAYGVTVATMDANGVQTQATYDDLGRPVTRKTDGSQDTTSISYYNRNDSGGGSNGTGITSTTGPVTAKTITDGLGRTMLSMTTGFDGQLKATTTAYDRLGRVGSTTAPAPGGTTRYAYDSLDRQLAVIDPAGKTVASSYTMFTTTTVDPVGNKATTTSDNDGRLIATTAVDASTTPPTDVTTTYTYAPFGNLAGVKDAAGNVTSYQYDIRGRIASIADPDKGTTTYTHYGTGEVRSETHTASGRMATYSYDDLGRATSVAITGGDASENGATTFAYDTAAHGIGRLAYAVSPDKIRVDYRYDTDGRQTGTDYTDDSVTPAVVYKVDTTFDSSGRPLTMQYPARFNGPTRYTVQYNYNNAGYLNLIRDVTGPGAVDLWTVSARTDDGRLDAAVLGNGLALKNTYDNGTARLHSATVTNPGSTEVQDLTYSYYDDGMLHTRTDTVNNRTDDYGYDSLGRLTTWSLTNATNATRTTAYTYDSIDRLTRIAADGTVETHAYGKPGGSQPHTLTSIGIDFGGGQGLVSPATYDSHGRQIAGDDRSGIAYTAFDLPKSVTRNGATSTYLYDAFGNKVKETKGANTTFYVPGVFERRTSADGTNDVFSINGPDGPVGQAVYNGSTTTTHYVLTDNQTSTTAVTDSAGAVTQKLFYEPFGASIQPDGTATTVAGDVTHRFTQHESDNDTGLINMKGRVYDPAQKTFLTDDPLNTPGSNPYAYVGNNPVNYTDPTGYRACPYDCTEHHGLMDNPGNSFIYGTGNWGATAGPGGGGGIGSNPLLDPTYWHTTTMTVNGHTGEILFGGTISEYMHVRAAGSSDYFGFKPTGYGQGYLIEAETVEGVMEGAAHPQAYDPYGPLSMRGINIACSDMGCRMDASYPSKLGISRDAQMNLAVGVFAGMVVVTTAGMGTVFLMGGGGAAGAATMIGGTAAGAGGPSLARVVGVFVAFCRANPSGCQNFVQNSMNLVNSPAARVALTSAATQVTAAATMLASAQANVASFTSYVQLAQDAVRANPNDVAAQMQVLAASRCLVSALAEASRAQEALNYASNNLANVAK